MNDMEIPMSEKHTCDNEDSALSILGPSRTCGTCGTHTCQAVRHIEDVAAEVDELRRELRSCERHHAEDCHKLWFKIGGVMVALAAVLPTGWAAFLGMI